VGCDATIAPWNIGACGTKGRSPTSRQTNAKKSIVISASIGSASLNMAPPRAPAESIIVKLCEEAFAVFCAAER
jgi:hypothetical protein